MNQNEAPTGFELPIPNENAAPETGQGSSEQLASALEVHNMPQVPAGLPQHQDVPVVDNNIPAMQAQPIAQGRDGSLTADDTDLIEKEWVTKAKQIVASTKHDPFQQNQEMSRVKADYLKKRYDKNIKTEGV